MRRLLIAAIPILLMGCSQPHAEVKLHLASDKAISVDEFELNKSEFSASGDPDCSVLISITYDISVEPRDFTGQVWIKDAQVKWAGWKSKEELVLQFVDGKQSAATLDEYEFARDEDLKEKKEALCRVQSSSDVKMIDLGKPQYAVYGVRASVNKVK
jgi:hypothetical protein